MNPCSLAQCMILSINFSPHRLLHLLPFTQLSHVGYSSVGNGGRSYGAFGQGQTQGGLSLLWSLWLSKRCLGKQRAGPGPNPPRSRGDSPGWPPPCWGGCSCTVWDARGLRPGAALAGQARLPARTRSVCGEEFGGKHRHGMARKQPSVLNPAHKHRQLPSKLHLNPPGSFVWHFYCGAVSRNVNLLLMTFFFFF